MSAAVTPEQFERIVWSLDEKSLGHLGSLLIERARLRRAQITIAEARAAIGSAPLTPGWESSQLADVGRVRIATRILIERGYHPSQVAQSMCEVALGLVPHPSIAPEAVAAGIADAQESE